MTRDSVNYPLVYPHYNWIKLWTHFAIYCRVRELCPIFVTTRQITIYQTRHLCHFCETSNLTPAEIKMVAAMSARMMARSSLVWIISTSWFELATPHRSSHSLWHRRTSPKGPIILRESGAVGPIMASRAEMSKKARILMGVTRYVRTT